MPCIQAVAACLACISFVDSLMERCAWITAFSTPRSHRRSPPSEHIRCALRGSTIWHPDLPIDGQQSRAVLCCPIQIDRSTICQLDRDEESLLVSFQCPSPHFGAGAFRCGCILARRLETSIWPFAERRRRRRARRLVRLRQETTKTAIRDAPTDGQRADAEATPCLAGLFAEKEDAREKVMLATRLTGSLDQK